jgi:hypothetical protein
MKNLLFILLVTFAFTSVNAQSNLTVNICGNTDGITVNEKAIEMTLSQEKLLECSDLLTNNKDWKVSYFVFAIHIEGSMYEMKETGNKLSKRMIALITKYNPKKIYLQKIKLVKGEETFTDVLPLILLMN